MTAKRKETGAAYLRVGTTIYKRVQQPLSSGRSIEILLAWNVETLRQDFGKDYLARIPKYDGFCTVPDHTNYRREIHGFLNRYEPIPFQPAEGDFPHIRGFLSHIFGEQVEMGYDYLQLLYLRPLQRLPVLLLVSSERNTGKTTFLNLLKLIFGGNVTFNTNEDFRSQFNDDWAGKLLICVDEVLLNRREDSERIKNLSTARSYKAEAKGRDRREVEFFGKFVLCSNNERNPVLIEAAETRYWVRRIPPLTHDDQQLLARMQTEIPGLLFFLQRRTLSTREESRLWFSPRHLGWREAGGVSVRRERHGEHAGDPRHSGRSSHRAADTDRELAAAAGTADLLPALYNHLQRVDPTPGEQDGTDLYRHAETA